ncbi:ATP-binding/permease protein CydD [mine drainage metagenome]|uniref:ATP-binding/permease protein CydD n=1 Tax=mine drainage metagenome TaxID=410659 RepID=A0A1J5Q0G4_9ZZZZ
MIQAGLIATLVVRIFHDHPTIHEISTQLYYLALTFAARALLSAAGEQIATQAGNRIRWQLRNKIIERILQDASLANRFGTAHLSTLATRGINAMDAYFARFLPQLLIALTVPVIVGVYIFYLDTTSGLIVIGTVPLIPLLGALIGSYTGVAMRKKWRTLGILSGYFLDLVSGVTTLKVFGRSKRQEERLREVGEEYRRNTMEVLRISFLSSLALEIIATLSVALIAVSIGLRLVGGSVDLRTGLLILILAPEVYWPMRTVGTHFHAAADGIEAGKQIFEVLDSPQTGGGSIPVDRISDISISPLSVMVGDRETTVAIPKALLRHGRIVAVTGPSGAGKSTLLSVLLGFLQPAEGSILVNGHELRDVEMKSWRSHVAWVPQHPHLNRGSIRDLVQVGREGASDLEITEALASAGLSKSLFPDGLDTIIGEGGTGISIGQARRIALARALVRRADLLLLDEPSAALDDLSEAEIAAAVVSEAKRGAIVVVVSHHEALIRIADETISIEKAGLALNEVSSGTS